MTLLAEKFMGVVDRLVHCRVQTLGVILHPSAKKIIESNVCGVVSAANMMYSLGWQALVATPPQIIHGFMTV